MNHKCLIWFLFLCLALAGCSSLDDGEGPEDPYPTDRIWACSDESYEPDTGYGTYEGNFDLEQPQYLTETMYHMLGMLDEYISRGNYWTGRPKPNLVEGFYPGETELADYFEALMLQFRDETPFPFDYSRETGDQGHHRFYSTELSELINSFYKGPNGYQGTLYRKVFCEASEEDMLAYIEGAYMRYGASYSILNDNYIDMANGTRKIVTIGYVLKTIGCDSVSVYVSSCEGCAPGISLVMFEPNQVVTDRLGIERVISIETLMEEHPTALGDPVIYQTIE
jgi:hypothetical protein